MIDIYKYWGRTATVRFLYWGMAELTFHKKSAVRHSDGGEACLLSKQTIIKSIMSCERFLYVEDLYTPDFLLLRLIQRNCS